MDAFAIASSYVAAGLSVLPIKTDGSKSPDVSSWDDYKNRHATANELKAWWDNGHIAGVAIIGGAVSGNLGVIDIEYDDFFGDFAAIVEEQSPGLLATLPIVRTPGREEGGGRHIYFRSAAPLATKKLARLTKALAKERTGDPQKTTCIELKAEGGYVLAPGCSADCHPSKRTYELIAGPEITEVPLLTDEEVDILLSAAKALDKSEEIKIEQGPKAKKGEPRGDRPGDVFNREADWSYILDGSGWILVFRRNGISYWRRPGKEKGISATTGYCRNNQSGELFYCFTSNGEPFEEGRAYSKFAVYTMLLFDGDWSKAAGCLSEEGYAEPFENKSEPDEDDGEDDDDDEPSIEVQQVVGDPFPVDVLPAPLQGFIKEVARSFECPLDFPGVAVLVVAASAIGASRAIQVNSSWKESPRIYCAIVADPGSAKTPVVELVANPLVDYQHKISAAYEESVKQYEEEKDDYDAARKKKGDAPSRPIKPVAPHVYVNDPTAESLPPILRDNPRGVLLIRDEITGWVGSMNQYKSGGKGADRQFWLSAWSGGAIKIDRKSSDSIRVRWPFIGVLGGIQPDMLGELQDVRGRQDGFVHRLLFSAPPDVRFAKTYKVGVSAASRDTWAKVVQNLLSMQMEEDENGEQCPRVVGMTVEAEIVADGWWEMHRREREKEDFPMGLVGPWSKMRAYFFRIALTIHYMRHACGEPNLHHDVDQGSMLAAAKIVDYFKSHTKAVFGLLTSSADDLKAERLLGWIERHGGKCTARDLMRSHFTKKTKDGKKILKDLEDRGFGKVHEMKNPKNGKKMDVFVRKE